MNNFRKTLIGIVLALSLANGNVFAKEPLICEDSINQYWSKYSYIYACVDLGDSLVYIHLPEAIYLSEGKRGEITKFAMSGVETKPEIKSVTVFSDDNLTIDCKPDHLARMVDQTRNRPKRVEMETFSEKEFCEYFNRAFDLLNRKYNLYQHPETPQK
jgi:hypothetical protein